MYFLKQVLSNRSHTRFVITCYTIIFAISGFFHGFFEALQGNATIESPFINAIGDNQLMWSHGHEPAFTLLKTYLGAGIASMLLSILIFFMIILFINHKYLKTAYILMFVGLLLVGGGIGHVLFFVPLWLSLVFGKNNTLSWTQKVSQTRIQRSIKTWNILLATGCFLLLLALELAMFGFLPFITSEVVLLTVMLVSLTLSWILMFISLKKASTLEKALVVKKQ